MVGYPDYGAHTDLDEEKDIFFTHQSAKNEATREQKQRIRMNAGKE